MPFDDYEPIFTEKNLSRSVNKVTRKKKLYNDNFNELDDDKPKKELSSSTKAALGGALSDYLMTGYGLKTKTIREGNPNLQWAKNDPTKTLLGLGGLDAVKAVGVHLIGKKYPKVADALKYGHAFQRFNLARKGHKIISRNLSNKQEYNNAPIDLRRPR